MQREPVITEVNFDLLRFAHHPPSMTAYKSISEICAMQKYHLSTAYKDGRHTSNANNSNNRQCTVCGAFKV